VDLDVVMDADVVAVVLVNVGRCVQGHDSDYVGVYD
jgi:hypothetical protein